MAGIPTVEKMVNIAKALGNIISGDNKFNELDYNTDLITRMIMTEAYENPGEWQAMANVVKNRNNRGYGFTIAKEGSTDIEKLIMSGDFHGVFDNEERFNNAQSTKQRKNKYNKIYEVVENVMIGDLSDNTNGATMYQKKKIEDGKKIGDHYYWNLYNE